MNRDRGRARRENKREREEPATENHRNFEPTSDDSKITDWAILPSPLRRFDVAERFGARTMSFAMKHESHAMTLYGMNPSLPTRDLIGRY